MSDNDAKPADVTQDIPTPAPEPVAEPVNEAVTEAVTEPVTEAVAPPPPPVEPAPVEPPPVAAAPVAPPVVPVPLPPPGGPTAPPQWPAAAYPAQPAQPAAAYPPPPAYPAYPPQYAPQPAQTSSNAVIALVLAVGAWVVCPLVLAIVALVFASMGTKEIAASGGRIEGQGLITAAKIVAWINIGVMAAALLIGLAIFLLAVLAGGVSTVN